MDDLISRSAVIDVLKETGIIQDNDLGHLVVDEINGIPTAYNVNKVVEHLYELGGVDGFDECAKAYDRAIEDSIKVVKAGGVNG